MLMRSLNWEQNRTNLWWSWTMLLKKSVVWWLRIWWDSIKHGHVHEAYVWVSDTCLILSLTCLPFFWNFFSRTCCWTSKDTFSDMQVNRRSPRTVEGERERERESQRQVEGRERQIDRGKRETSWEKDGQIEEKENKP